MEPAFGVYFDLKLDSQEGSVLKEIDESGVAFRFIFKPAFMTVDPRRPPKCPVGRVVSIAREQTLMHERAVEAFKLSAVESALHSIILQRVKSVNRLHWKIGEAVPVILLACGLTERAKH